MKYFYINSRLNNGLAAVALSVAAHVRVHGIPLRVYCVGVRARICRYTCGHWARVVVQNLSLVDNMITKGLFFIGTKQEQFWHILQCD